MTTLKAKITTLRQRVYANGYRIVPVLTAAKRPSICEWQRFDGVPEFNPDALNTGLLSGLLIPLDLDDEDRDRTAFITRQAHRLFGGAPERFRDNSEHLALLYQSTGIVLPKHVIKYAGGKVERLGEGQQLVGFGTHPSGVPYRWRHKSPHSKRLKDVNLIDLDAYAEFAAIVQRQFPLEKPGARTNGWTGDERARAHDQTDGELIEIVRTAGAGLHGAIVMLAARYIGLGIPGGSAVKLIRGYMEELPETSRTQRWHDRYADVPRAVATAEAKWGQTQDETDEFGERSGQPADPFAGTEELPLCPEPTAPTPYPLAALGPLQAVVEGIAGSVGCDPALAAQSVLMTACLATMGIADIELPRIGVTVLSLSFVTIARSSERKTSADERALRGVKAFVAQLTDLRKLQETHHRNEVKSYQAQANLILRDKKLDRAARTRALDALGPEPAPLPHPTLASGDLTVQGLLKEWSRGMLYPVQALTTSEGGMFVTGAAMSSEMRSATTATLNTLWDGEPLNRLRSGDGVMVTGTKRLTVHFMLQPSYVPAFLGDAELRGQGFLSRLLVAWPPSRIGKRIGSTGTPKGQAAQDAFADRVHQLLTKHLAPEIEPRTIKLDAAAAQLCERYLDEIEVAQDKGKPYEALTDVAGKSGEMAGRIAGVLALFAKPGADTVSVETMRAAIALARWYLNEAFRIAETGMLRPEIAAARELLEWLKANPGRQSRSGVLTYGPNRLRDKATLDPVLRILADHNLIVLPKEGPIRVRD